MTRQFDDFAARRTREGWSLARVEEGGGGRIHLLDEQGERQRSIDLKSSLPGYARFSRWTTAGMLWSQQLLAYFTERQRHFVVRPWWGERLVVDLDRLEPIDSQELADELTSTESDIVMQGLRQLVSEVERGQQPKYARAPADQVQFTVDTLAYLPGLLGLVEAIPLLLVLEERMGPSGEVWGEFRYHSCVNRRLAQISLRRLGRKPRGHPALMFAASERRLSLRAPQTGPIDGHTRHTELLRIAQGTPIFDVYRLLGAPDQIGAAATSDFWLYDVDFEQPYTVVLWLGKEDDIARIVRYLPAFWKSPEFFPSTGHSLFHANGKIIGILPTDSDNDAFIGARIDVGVLQELAQSRWEPLVALARVVLEGEHLALGPLADALEEIEDARASQVRNWFNKLVGRTQV